jgi:signal recognition particle receptor subunit beta
MDSGPPEEPKKAAVDYRAVIGTAWLQLQELARAEQRQALVSQLEPVMQRFKLGLFRLVVMGEIKKGKSSFVNALLGEHDLLPTQSDVATSTVYKLLYGPQRKFKVFFQADIDTGKRREVAEISPEQLKDYGTEDGNPKNEKRVDFIGVELPHPLLKEGLVLVDTPGVGGLFRAHGDISLRYAPNADAVFFVLDSVEAVISRDEIQFLRELTTKGTKRVFFVQTKTDIADTEQWQAWQARNKQVLSESLGIPPAQLYYFPVSSKLKKIADHRLDGRRLTDSGFLTVLDFLHRGLMAAKDRQMAGDVAQRFLQTCQQLAQGVQEQVHLYQDRSKEESERLREDYRRVKQELEQWNRTTYSEQVQRFGDQFTELRQKAVQSLQEELDPCGSIVTEIIGNLRANQADPAKIAEAAREIQQEWLMVVAERVGKLQREFNSRVSALLSETCRSLFAGHESTAVGHVLAQQSNEALADLPTEELPVHFGQFEALRNVVYGGMAGAMMANVAVGVVAFVFPPAALVVGLAACAAPVIGAWCARSELKCRQREEALMKLQGALQNLARRCQRQALNQFTEIATSYERYARDTFKNAGEQAKETLQQRLKQVEEAGLQTKEQRQAQGQSLKRRLQEIIALEQSLRAILNKPA